MGITDDVVVVVPTIREASIREFLAAWQWPCPVIVVEDNPTRTFPISSPNVTHVAWDDIRADLGADEWIIPRRSDCVRSYGYLLAYRTGRPYIVTLDDDCLPAAPQVRPGLAALEFLQQHINNLQPHDAPAWHNTLAGRPYPRGVPYQQRARTTPVGLSHGLWRGTRDWDSLAALHYGRDGEPPHTEREGLVPQGSYFPMCGMNLAWRRELTPLLYFLLMGKDETGQAPYAYDRFGDIWAGILAKKVLDHLGIGVWSGGPVVHHARASNVWANFQKEHAGIIANEDFWQRVDAIPLTKDRPAQCYYELGWAVHQWEGDYWQRLGNAMQIWVEQLALSNGAAREATLARLLEVPA